MTKWKCELDSHCSPTFFIHPTLLIYILVPRNHLCACRLFCLLQNVSFALGSSWVEKCCWKLNVAASSSATSGQCMLVISLLSPCRWSFPQWPEADTFWCCMLVWTSQMYVSCLVVRMLLCFPPLLLTLPGWIIALSSEMRLRLWFAAPLISLCQAKCLYTHIPWLVASHLKAPLLWG